MSPVLLRLILKAIQTKRKDLFVGHFPLQVVSKLIQMEVAPWRIIEVGLEALLERTNESG